MLFIVILAYDALKAMWFVDPLTGATEFGIGVGTIVLTLNVVFLGGYTFGCHSLRHLIGGGRDILSDSPLKLNLWKRVDLVQLRHMNFAWPACSGSVSPTLRSALLDGDLDGLEDSLGSNMPDAETFQYDVLIVGAGGAGLRARHRGIECGRQGRHRLQVAARQGAYGDGRRRHGGRSRQRRRPRQLEGSFRRHDARRAVPEQVADGRVARPGIGRSGSRKWKPGDRLFDRTNDGRISATEFRRPPLSAAGAHRRPHGPGNDPHTLQEPRRPSRPGCPHGARGHRIADR